MKSVKSILVTGGAGFIGSALIRNLIKSTDHFVINFDKLTYAGNLDSLKEIEKSDRYNFIQGDISDRDLVDKIFKEYQPTTVMHLAAESHVDRSIDGPSEFIKTNILGTFTLLESSLQYWLKSKKPNTFRFQHISTDEVFGSLKDGEFFYEDSRYSPNSPYSASKASSDHLVRAWHKTYGLPVIVTNCSNNYGPYHYPEKLIPLIISLALNEKKLPVYGDGLQVRDWLYVDDHAEALIRVHEEGKIGETYNIGGDEQKTNIEVVKTICKILDEIFPLPAKSRSDLINHINDRPGHDRRYAIDCTKIKTELGWMQKENFESGIRKTIEWFLSNQEWVSKVTNNKYSYERLGNAKV